MNERIRELADQAGVSITAADKNGVFTLLPDNQKKFAELIVRECLSIALKSGSVTNKSEVAVAEADRIYHKIKQHFGVD